MFDINMETIYNNKYLVIIPEKYKDLVDALEYSFGNTIIINEDNCIAKIIKFINRNNFKQLILVNYIDEYKLLLDKINSKHVIKSIFTESLGAFSDSTILNQYYEIYNLYKENKIKSIGYTDKGLYETMSKNNKNIYNIYLDIKEEHNSKREFEENNYIGILNKQENTKHSVYNELSAIKLNGKYTPKLSYITNTTKSFLKIFNLKKKIVSERKLYKDNILNLYINFTDSNLINFIKSMDNNIPCILGNTTILDNYEELKKNLVMKSDDNIDEISKKIDIVVKNRDNIINEYKKFRSEYSKISKETITSFLETPKEENKQEKEYEVLLSVVVPVYNVEKYLKKSLSSIIDASIENMEILIINDGSTDNSEKIINKYKKNYPNLIRYIKQENHGLGNVRNVALKEAKGKYIASIDSDDTIDMDFFIDAQESMENDIDIIIYDWLTVTNKEKYETLASDAIFDNKEMNRYEALLYTSIMPSTCNKIIKKSLFEELDIKYIEDKYEDLSTNPFIMLKANTINYINKPYYEYYIRSGSIMRSNAGLSMINVIKLVEERLEKYKDIVNIDINDFKYYTYSWRIEEYIINQLYTMKEEEIHSFIEYINKNIRNIVLDIFNNQKYLDMLEKLDEKEKKYIISRNEAFEKNKLEEFIKKSINKKDIFKLTPMIIYYVKK